MNEERRAYQRLHLPSPVAGRFLDRDVGLVELSATGTHLRCDDELPVGARGTLHFRWRGEDVDVPAEIVWSEDRRAGLRFRDYPDALRRLLEDAVTEILRAQEITERKPTVIDESPEFPVAEVFVSWTLNDGVWTRRPSLLPEQPANGFTVSASEAAEHVDLLCRTFESGDRETRRLTRMFAELSVSR